MTDFESSNLIPLYKDEEKAFRRKENWQRRFIAWFGLGTGISCAVQFGRAYYHLVATRYTVPDITDTGHIDLEFNALLGIIVGILIAVIPVIVAFIMGKRRPQAFAAEKNEGSKMSAWTVSILSILIPVCIIALGLSFIAGALSFRWAPGIGGMELIVLFGALLLATPLLVEGIWSFYATKQGIKRVFVLRKNKWRKG